jgi:hypothetical protein
MHVHRQERARRYVQAHEQEPVWDLEHREQRECWGRLLDQPPVVEDRFWKVLIRTVSFEVLTKVK